MSTIHEHGEHITAHARTGLPMGDPRCATCNLIRHTGEPVPVDERPADWRGERRLMADLVAGDQYVRRDADGRPTIVTVLDQHAPGYTDPLGRRMRALRATAEGREGLVPYGTGGTVEIP